MTDSMVDQTQSLSRLPVDNTGGHLPRPYKMIANRARYYFMDNWLPITGIGLTIAMAVMAA